MTEPDPASLSFIPLGGSGAFGMNCNLYATEDRILMVDCGVSFLRVVGGDNQITMPDPAWIARRREKLVGLVLTHGHEDHIGAVAAMWPQLRCPIFATPFTAHLLRGRLASAGLASVVQLIEVPAGGRAKVGPFRLRFIGMTHSIAEAQSVVIETKHGKVLHTGDWKLDPDPRIGPVTDEAALRSLAKSGLLAAVSDSTNATRPGWSTSEAAVEARLTERIAAAEGMVVTACFASNVARIQSLCRAADAAGRSVVVLGRSLHRMINAARATGYLDDLPSLVPLRHAGYLPREATLLLCTGTQGEPMAALARLAMGRFRDIRLTPGDTALFSSKIIPGNELPIEWLHRALTEQGVTVIHEQDDPGIHASGHPCQDELATLYGWTKPSMVIPVHGTHRHLEAHCALARQLGIPSVKIENGVILRLAPGAATIVGRVQVGEVLRPDVEKDEHFAAAVKAEIERSPTSK
ncbi:MAG: ribonuclease J [Myxococcota bacterium]|nr:ribonuclease J [Myxococcota bacterium]